jgi:hypothetical protein
MNEEDFDFPEYATAYSKEARVMRYQLPDAAGQALTKVVDQLAFDPDSFPERTTASDTHNDQFIYRHPMPRLELTYRIDRERKLIYFLHVAAPKLEVAKPLFVSYAHEDKRWLLDLRKWLKPLERKDLIKVWDDRDIESGDRWYSEIEASLNDAKVALLLVSQNFVDSEFIANEELPRLLEAADTRGVKILWVAVDVSIVEDAFPELLELQAMNSDPELPLALLDQKQLALEFKEIYKRIKAAVEE